MKIVLFAFAFLSLHLAEGYDYGSYGEAKEEDPHTPDGPLITHFRTFIDSLPTNVKKDSLEFETESLIELLYSYDRAKDRIRPYDVFHENRFDNYKYNSFDMDTHVNVAFIGLPQSAISRVRELWFDDLSREDALEAYDASTGQIIGAPKDVNIKHHFNLLETSFHAHDAISKYMLSIIQPEQKNLSPFKFYFNSWEIEAMLYTLTARMADHNKEALSKATMTIYVLSLKAFEEVYGENEFDVYTYRNGFSEWDMDIIRTNSECKRLALGVLHELSHSSRRSVEADTSLLPLHTEIDLHDLPPYAQEEKAGGEENAWGNAENAGGEHRNMEGSEIKSSKKWAKEFSSKMDSLGTKRTLVQRVEYILTNPDKNPVFDQYRHILARAILTKGAMMEDTPTSNARDFMSRTDNVCGTSGWAGSSGVAWLDLNVGAGEELPIRESEGSRHRHHHHHIDDHDTPGSAHSSNSADNSHKGHHSSADWKHALINVEEAMMMRGSGGSPDGARDLHPEWKEDALAHETQSLKNTLQLQLNHVDEIVARLTCPYSPLVDDVVRNAEAIHEGWSYAFEMVAEKIREKMDLEDDARLNEACALLYLERAFIYLVLESSDLVFKLTQAGLVIDGTQANRKQPRKKQPHSSQAGGDDDDYGADDEAEAMLDDEEVQAVYQEDMTIIVNSILAEALDKSNVFVGKGHFSKHGFSDYSVNHAFAKVAKMVLRTTRQLVSRPLMLHPQQQVYKHKSSGFPKLPLLPKETTTTNKLPTSNLLDLFHDMHSIVATSTDNEVLHSRDNMYGYETYEDSSSDDKGSGPAWEDLLPALYIPKHVEIEIFVVRLQNSYEPIDDVDAFHMPFFTSELEKLRLPNQQMSFSVHTIDALEESSLHMGINACRRYAVVKNHTNGGGSITSTEKMFLSSECLWRHFQHIDDASRDAATWLKRHPDSLFSNTQHLPIFILSMDDFTPLYLARDGQDSLHSALHFGDSVLVVQNSFVEYPNGYSCNGNPVLANLRNPLGPALSAAASALVGLAGVEPGVELPVEAHHRDRSALSCGGSPFFRGLGALHPQFSQFDVASGHRNRVLRSIDFSSHLSYNNFQDMSYGGYHEHRTVHSLYDHLDQVKEAIHRFDWARASALANSILKQVVAERKRLDEFIEKDRLEVKKGKHEQLKGKSKSSGSDSFSKSLKETVKKAIFALPTVLFGAVASGSVTFVLFVLFNTVLSGRDNPRLPI